MKQNSVNAPDVDWNTVQRTALAKAHDINNAYELGPVMRYIYSTVNDFHGTFFYKDSSFKWSHNEPVISDSIRNEWKKGVFVVTRMLPNNVGYLRIPSMSFSSFEDGNKKAQALNDSLCALLEKNCKGLIIDLRLNGGGAMHPMILGVEQLLEPGNIGSFRGRKKEDWIIKNNGFFVDTSLITKIIPGCTIKASGIPAVLLVSPITGSSAEFFIMAFKGRPNTILLGSKTAGYVTVIAGLPINDAAYMYLSVGYGADRNGTVYKKAFEPDILSTAPDSFNDIANDEKVKAAANWLTMHANH